MSDELISDYDQHYCEYSPSYYCEEWYCENKEFNFQCPFKKERLENEKKRTQKN